MSEDAPFIPYADASALDEPLRAALAAYENRMGFMPNALRLYMHRPEILSALIRLNDTVMRDPSGHLDPALKRRIAAICSHLNQSAYCVAHNVNTLTSASDGEGEGWDFSETQVAELLDPSHVPDSTVERLAVEYARAATLGHGTVPAALLDELAAHMTPPQIVELACVVGFWKMYNSVHEALHVPIEEGLQNGLASALS